jgi:hypothetical protein
MYNKEYKVRIFIFKQQVKETTAKPNQYNPHTTPQ